MTPSRVLAAALAFILATSAVQGQTAGDDPTPAPLAAEPGSVDTPADTSAPPAPAERHGVVQKMRTWTSDVQLLGRLEGTVNGWYPRIGGITRGSGFAGGPGVRGDVLGDALFLDVSGAISTRGYKAADVRARWLRAFDRRLALWTEFRYEDFPQEDFFGTGMSSTSDARTSYDFDRSDVLVRGVVTPYRWLHLDATAGYMRPDIGSGSDDRYPSIEQLFTDADAPGLARQPDFLHTAVAAAIDYRDTAGNTASGGLYRASYGIWNDVTLDEFNFQRFDAHLVQFVPLVPSKRHVLAARIGASFVNNARGDRVPFYFLPYVGGMDTIRSFREFRFKDENALWVSSEYRWRPASFLSVAAFADAGEVSANWEEVDLKGMRTGYGFGIGFHQSGETVLRLDFGTGAGVGWQMFIKLRPAF